MAGPIRVQPTADRERVGIVHSLSDVLDAMDALHGGPLPGGAVIIPHSGLRHALRRAAGKDVAKRLAGWRLMTPLHAALMVLKESGVHIEPGLERILPFSLQSLFASGELSQGLEYFQADQLRTGPGFAAAFADTIKSLAKAGFGPADLRDVKIDGTARSRARDIATIWGKLPRPADRWDTPTILFRAAEILTKQPDLWTVTGPTCVLFTRPSPSEVRFLSALPRLEPLVLSLRPLRAEYTDSIRELGRALGDPGLEDRIGENATPITSDREIDRLRALVFESPDVQSKTPPAAKKNDGSVQFELYSGVEEELDAALNWVAREVFEFKTPLEEIAILVPDPDPFLGMLLERLSGLPWKSAEPLVYVPEGVPSTVKASACRLKSFLEALLNSLSGKSLLKLLPALVLARRSDTDQTARLSRARAGQILFSCGAIGGTPGDPTRGLEWSARLKKSHETCTAEIAARSKEIDDDPDSRRYVRGLLDLTRLKDGIEQILPAVISLTNEVYAQVLKKASLKDIWTCVKKFAEDHLRVSQDESAILEQMDEFLAPLLSLAGSKHITGTDAVRALQDVLLQTRIPIGRFGEPRIFLGTLASAEGLRFKAVRIVGLCEGSIPRNPREDAVLPDVDRRTLRKATGAMVDRAADLVLESIHSFVLAVRSAQDRLALSVPRESIDGTAREPAGAILEAATALSRNGLVTSIDALHRDYFEPGVSHLSSFRDRIMLTPRGVAARVARSKPASTRIVPANWFAPPSLDVRKFRDLHQDHARGLVVRLDPSFNGIPGLTNKRPISASRLQRLLTCPQRFVFQDILHWDEPFEPPSIDEIDSLPYGTLLHSAMQAFYERHGKEFSLRKQADWLGIASEIATESFERFLDQYPLSGQAVISHEKARLVRDVRTLVSFAMTRPPEDFVAAEWPFGETTGIALKIAETVLHVRGYVDRLDRSSKGILIWDYKSGKLDHQNKKKFDVGNDIQLGVYLHVLDHASKEQGWPQVGMVTYLSPQDRGLRQRGAMEDDIEEFRTLSGEWLVMAADLLQSRAFPHAVDKDACEFCPFANTVCDEDAPARARRVLEGLMDQDIAKRYLAFATGGDSGGKDARPDPPAAGPGGAGKSQESSGRKRSGGRGGGNR